MKKLLFILVLVIGIILTGCNEKPPTYYYEAHLITMFQYNNFIHNHPLGTHYTFNEIKEFRRILRNLNGQFIISEAGVSEEDVKKFANERGIGGSEYTEFKDLLDTNGNMILFFTYTLDPMNYIAWFYVEKE
jgi:hypothetical protein